MEEHFHHSSECLTDALNKLPPMLKANKKQHGRRWRCFASWTTANRISRTTKVGRDFASEPKDLGFKSYKSV